MDRMPAPSTRPEEGRMKKVLVLCTGNSARSQMMESILNDRLADRVQAKSAGTNPAPRVNPLAVTALSEIGIEHDGNAPKSPDAFGDESFDVAITVCDHAKESCPVLPGAPKTIHIGYPDPETIEAFRDVRDHMLAWVELYRVLGG
jgi:arsenate reductase